MYTVYLHTNKITGKKYVGMTCQIPWTRRFNGDGSGYKGCRYFWSAIKKYGWENFEHQILDIFEKEEDAMESEKYYIELFNTTDRNYGYNIKTGGQHQHFPDEIKENIRKANAGRATRGSGWKHSEETKEKIRNSQKGRPLTPEHAENSRRATREYYKTHSPAHTFTKEDHDNALNARRKKYESLKLDKYLFQFENARSI